MHVHIITLRFNAALEAFDETPLREFVKDKHLLSIRDHFFTRHEIPYLALVLTYEQQEKGTASAKNSKTADESWRKMIQEPDLPLFNTLRSWRAELAKKDGIPPYIICTNRQLAEIVNLKPQSLAGFQRIDGFGNKKVEKYGKAMLSFFRTEKDKITTKGETDQQGTDSNPPEANPKKEPAHDAKKE
jgi:superfamily II DNA helicase RecQ